MLDYGSPDELYWDAGREEVRFSVANGERQLLFRIAGEALVEHCGVPLQGPACLAAARVNFGRITHRISDKLSLGLSEPDGSILIGAKDW